MNAKSDKKGLIFLLPSLAGGGAERVASILIPEFYRDFDLTLVLLDGSMDYKLPDNVRPVVLGRPSSSPLVHILRIPYQVARISRMVKRIRPIAVLSFMEQANIINTLASIITKHPTILSERNDPVKQYSYKGLLGKSILFASKYLYKRARITICVSKQICRTLETYYSINPCNLTFIPNPINPDPIDHTCHAKIDIRQHFILQVGRLTVQKGQDITLRAFRNLLEVFPNLHLVFAGEGPDRQRLEQLAKKLGVYEKIRFLGWVKDPRPLMKKALFLVHPSRYEGWPNVLAEALWCGCPVIATRCGGGPEEMLEDGRFGMLIAPDNEKELEKAMRLFLEDGELRKGFMEAGRIRARDFEPSKIALRYKKVIEEAALRAD